MIFAKRLITTTMGLFTVYDMPELRYSTYKPNAIDKVFFQISRFVFWALLLSFIITLITASLIPDSRQPDIVEFNFFGVEHIPFLAGFLIVVVTLPGLPLSVYLCSLTGYKSLKIDIGLRLIILIPILSWLMPMAIQYLIAYIALFV